MARQKSVLEFRVEEPGMVVEQMDRLGEMHRGWVNLRPALPADDEPPPPTGLDMLFSTAVHDVPICTWVAGKAGRRGVESDSLGVQHSAGTKTLAHLGSLGVSLPQGWRAVQDHPRRGLVVLAPAGTGHAQELAWLLRAGTALSRVHLSGEWRAEVHGAT
ncbi:MAG: hypothetical protein ABSH04_03170 [Acidimicrobiales bacterium]